jgi:hypothetical protein
MAYTLEYVQRRGRRAAPEADFQSQLVAVLRERLIDAIVCHVPNGVNMPMPTAMKLRRMGLLSGVPDLCIMHGGGKTLWLECKSGTGSVSPKQRDIIDTMRAMGHRVEVVRTIAEALTFSGEAGIAIKDIDKAGASALWRAEIAKVRRRS